MVKRYDIKRLIGPLNYTNAPYPVDIHEYADGPWVGYTDYDALLAENARLTAKLAEYTAEIEADIVAFKERDRVMEQAVAVTTTLRTERDAALARAEAAEKRVAELEGGSNSACVELTPYALPTESFANVAFSYGAALPAAEAKENSGE